MKTWTLAALAALFFASSLYSQQTFPIWTETIGVSTQHYNVSDFSVDSTGNSYVLAFVQDTSMMNTNSRIELFKYDSYGQLLWSDTLTTFEFYSKMSVAENGDIFVATDRWNGNGYDFFIRKWDNNGNRIWTHQFGAAQSCVGGRINRMAIDRYNSIYVAGQTFSNPSDAVMLKCDSAGSLIWNDTFSLYPNRYDRAYGIDYDSGGNAYVAVMSQDTDNYPDAVVLKYSPAGQRIWQQKFGGPDYEWPKFLKVYNDTSIYIAGDRDSSNGGSDYFALNYSTNGQLRWDQTFDAETYYNYPFPKTDRVLDMKVAHNGNLVLTGSCFEGSGAPRRINVCYSPQGNLSWVHRDFKAAVGSSIAEDSDGNFIFTGWAYDTTYNIMALGISKYDSIGTRTWAEFYFPSLMSNFSTSFVGVDMFGNIYCSSDFMQFAHLEILTIKFENTVGIVEGNNNSAVSAFPNPCISHILFSSAESRIDRIELLNIDGKVVSDIQNISSSTFDFNRSNLADGVYIYRLRLENGTTVTGKIVAISN